ncbi:hypothetical protein AB0I81_34785 [Nonomuraea sp. NPDC050404]|uniref:hypothetical protein n=1 Tax=Nonomuraea sp. NPDC050404 TaxID=3155783 RepID=UPI0033C41189
MANEVTITVRGSDRTGTLFSGIATKANAAFAQVRQSIRSHLDGSVKDADSSGKSIGSRLVSAVGSAVSSGAGAIKDALSTGFEMASKAAGPVLIGVLGGVLAAAGPTIGAALGGAITLGLGAGFVGIGAMLLLQNEKIRAEFAKTGNEIKAIMTDAAKPLLPVFQEAWSGVKRLVQEFNPIFKQAFQDAQGPLKEFTGQLLGAFRELKPAVQPIMDAFTGLLTQIGPQLKGVFSNIASSLTDLSRVVLENKTTIATLFVGLLQAIPAVISGIASVVSFFGTMLGVVNNVNVGLTRAFVGGTTAVADFATRFLGVMRSIGEAISNMPGMEQIGQKLIAGIDQAIGKVNEWKRVAQEAGKAVELKANIFDLTQKLDQAKAALADPNLTKERRAELNADIAKLQAAKAKAISELGDPKLTKEYRSTITTEIAELQARLATAKKELQNPELTKERKSKLNAEISQLQAQVSAAKAALASIPNKTVTVTVRTVGDTSIYKAGSVTASTRAHGGVIGAAGGGPRSNMTLVGEQGPELVRLPFGSTVIPNGQSERMLAQGGSGGVVVNLYVQGSIRSDRELVALIRDEFVNGGFRGALANA